MEMRWLQDYLKKVRQCDALSDILLGNSGFCIHVDITHLNIVADQVHPFTAMEFSENNILFA